MIQGIPDEKAKEISKFVKPSVPKIADPDPGVPGPRVRQERTTSSRRSRAVKEEDFGLALQFTNYRPYPFRGARPHDAVLHGSRTARRLPDPQEVVDGIWNG